MTKKLLIAAILIVAAILSHGQGFYLGLKTGYGFVLSGDYYGSSNYSQTEENHTSSGGKDNYTTTNSAKPGGFGENVNFSLQAGYMFSKILGVELNGTYNYGKQIEYTYNYSYKNYDDQDALSYTSLNNSNTRYRYTSFNLNPSLVFKLPLESKFRPYVKAGAIINLLYNLKSEGNSSVSYHNNGSSTTNLIGTSTSDTKGSVNLGFSTSIGSDYMITDKFAIFGELNYMGIIFSPSSSENNSTTSTTNTANYNVNTSTSHSTITFTDSYTTSSNFTQVFTPITGDGISGGGKYVTTYTDGRVTTQTSITYTNGNSTLNNESTGQKALKSAYPSFSTIGLSVGVRYYFGKQ